MKKKYYDLEERRKAGKIGIFTKWELEKKRKGEDELPHNVPN